MKLLLALDGSPQSLIARDLVAKLEWPVGTTVDLLSAYQVPVDWTGGVASSMAWVGDAADAVRDQLTADLATQAAPLTERGLTVERHVIQGRAADTILDAAKRLGTGLIVTGSRGRSRLTSILLGSVASEVAAHAICPVLVARGTEISRVLVATDGSEQALAIPGLLGEWGFLAGTPVDAVAVAVPDSPAYELVVSLYTLGDKRLAEQRAELQSAADRDAAAMAAALNEAGLPATPHVVSGDAAAEIVAAAKEQGADLIVTGSRGLTGMDRVLLGSVARNVLTHAPTSVLIVRNSASG
jgi:nucleotide-binding universal stress UspA family protein